MKTEDFSIELKTNYPFENRFEYTVESKKDFALKIRVPSFAKNLIVNGTAVAFCEELSFDIKSGENVHINVEFTTLPTLIDRPHDLKSVRCGSLVFSLPIAFDAKILDGYRNEWISKEDLLSHANKYKKGILI